MVSTAEGVKLIAAETGRLKEYLQGTTSNEWGLASPCEGWTVGDVIGHLGWAAEFFADAIAQGRAGVTSAPEGLPEIGSMPLTVLPDFIARVAKGYSSAADSDLVDAFYSSVDRLEGIFSIMEDSDWRKECWGLRQLQPASAYVTTRISEVVIHSWDIRFPSDPKAGLTPDCVAPVLDRLPVWLNSLGLAGFRPATTPARYRIKTTGAADLQRDVTAGREETRVEEAQGEPTATLACDAEALALLVWGRLKPAQLLADGRLRAISGTGTADAFCDWLTT
ncbi:MAG: maleylpyruvate isomerase family mycothiol-dependent enzyme [Chloroflexi bacterium]|nr:maleylpyruvate isomerase family mycothiol-dependent enzyme [Chloroflexota bacterium]MDA1270142.1 maleylpyruvate isomerase family mycothiol-dependent enzyme [Chloroflexota bacterium]